MANNMQALMAQAQKMQRQLKQKMAELAEKEFTVTKGGGIKVVMTGDRTVVEIDIDDDLLEKDNKEMIETMLILAYNECLDLIKSEEEKINNEITGGLPGGF